MQSLAQTRFQQFSKKYTLSILLALAVLASSLFWLVSRDSGRETEITPQQLRADSYGAYKKGDYKVAVKKLENYMIIAPKDADALELLASTYTLTGEKEKALEKTKALLKFHPNEPDILYRLGQYSADLKRYDDSISYLNNALEFKKDMFQAHHALARVYVEEKKYDLALEQLKQVLKSLPPKDKYRATICAEMGYIYRLKDDLQKSNDMYEQAIVIDPTNEAFKERLAEITR